MGNRNTPAASRSTATAVSPRERSCGNACFQKRNATSGPYAQTPANDARRIAEIARVAQLILAARGALGDLEADGQHHAESEIAREQPGLAHQPDHHRAGEGGQEPLAVER